MIWNFFFLKEFRKYPFFFLLLVFTIFLGTVGLTGITLISGQVQEKISSHAHELLTSDIAVSARRALSEKEMKTITDVMRTVPHAEYQVIDLYSMVILKKTGESRLVEVIGVEAGFPFYGKLETEAPAKNGSVLISRELADFWKAGPGDEIKVGDQSLLVSGILKTDTSVGLRGFSFAPRLYVPLQVLRTTGLLKPGVTGSFSVHFRLGGPASVKDLRKKIYDVIKDPAVRVNLPEESSEQTGRMMAIIKNFMALSGLIGLILALVGVFYLYQSHLNARLKDLCLLNLFGVDKPSMALFILVQFSCVFLFALILEVAVLVPLYRSLAGVLSVQLGVDLSPEINLGSFFALLPYLYILSVAVLAPLLMGILRTPMGAQLKAGRISLGRFRYYDFLPFIVLLWFLSWRLSQSLRIGSLFFVSLLMVFAVSSLLIKGGQTLIRRFIQGKGLLNPGIELGLALRNLTRSGHKLTLSFLSLTLGATLISLILQLDRMIEKEVSWDDSRPGLFVFDIQEEQATDLQKFSEDFKTPLKAMTPLIRARLLSINGKKFVRQNSSLSVRADEDEDNRNRNDALNLTFRSFLTPGEKIVDGEPFPAEPSPDRPAFVSVEKRWAERMGLGLGDDVLFDVQGVEFSGNIRNFREVKWTTFYPNFFVTVEPGYLDGAPKTYLAILPSVGKEKKIEFQKRAVELFPNISFIDIEELVAKIYVLFEKSRTAIQIISWLSLAVGLVILYGLSHDQVYRRYYDLALLKSLGLTTSRLLKNIIYEFGLLFASALSSGFILGWLIAQLIGKEVFKLSLSIDWFRFFVPAAVLSGVCLLTIILSSWRAVRARPRELLSDS